MRPVLLLRAGLFFKHQNGAAAHKRPVFLLWRRLLCAAARRFGGVVSRGKKTSARLPILLGDVTRTGAMEQSIMELPKCFSIVAIGDHERSLSRSPPLVGKTDVNGGAAEDSLEADCQTIDVGGFLLETDNQGQGRKCKARTLAAKKPR
jgi:hypothetical protein